MTVDVALFSVADEASELFCMIFEIFGTMFELLKGEDFKLTGLELLQPFSVLEVARFICFLISESSTDIPAELDAALFCIDNEPNELFCVICEVYGTMFELFKGEEALPYLELTGLELLSEVVGNLELSMFLHVAFSFGFTELFSHF